MTSRRAASLIGAAVAVALLLAGCTTSTSQDPAPWAGIPQGPTAPHNPTDGGWVVDRVIDGDTIVVARNGALLKVRLLGIDTPESVKANTPVQCWGPEASVFTTDLLTGKTVLLERDPSQPAYDQYGRRLEHVWLPKTDGAPDLLVNWYLVREGFAHARTYGTPTSWQSDYERAQATARALRLGFWSPATCNGDTSKPA